MSPCLAPVFCEGFEGSPDDTIGEEGDRCADYLVSTADGEGHSVALVGRISFEDTVGRGVVAGCIHGVRAGLIEGSLYRSVSC